MALSAREIVAKGVGERVLRYRKQRKLSQEAVARRMGMSVATVRFIENAEGAPEWETLEKLADALEVEWWDLLPSRDDAGFDLTPSKAGALAAATAAA